MGSAQAVAVVSETSPVCTYRSAVLISRDPILGLDPIPCLVYETQWLCP